MGVLIDNPLLLLFLVMGAGAALGTLRVGGVALGPAAALFVGLAVSAADDRLANTPVIVTQVGLGLFIYAIGLASGPSFLAQLRRGGAKVLLGAAALLGLVALAVVGVGRLLDLDVGARAGLFAGSLTNTPALSAAIGGLGDKITDGSVTDPVVGYSLAYPFGVLMMLLAAHWSLRSGAMRGATSAAPATSTSGAASRNATNATLFVQREGLPSLGDLQTWEDGKFAFGRVEHDGMVEIATSDLVLVPGDLCTVIGAPEDVERLIAWAGRHSRRHLALDRASLDFRRISLSNRKLAGKKLRELRLESRYGATVTRVRRGDSDLVADADFVLRLGDRLRVVGPASRLGEVATLLGDSDRMLGEVDAMGFALGLSIGLLIGLIEVPLPGGGSIELGVGGGPLIAGLVLGTLSRTGPITWQIPHAANLTLRQVGLLMFLGAIGIRSGATFADAAGTALGGRLALAAFIVTGGLAVASIVLTRLLHSDPVSAAGQIAGIETQPAVAAYAAESTKGDERVDAGYALVLPLAMILKLILVQLIL